MDKSYIYIIILLHLIKFTGTLQLPSYRQVVELKDKKPLVTGC